MPSLALAGAAGAGQGLEQVLNRIAEDAKMEQLKKIQNGQLDESVRSHTANEAIDRERIAATERERVSRDAATQAERDRAEGRAARDDSRQAMDTIPSGTVIPETDPTVKMADTAGFGSLLRGVKSRPAVPVGPLQEEDQGQAIPVDSRIKLKSFSQQKEAASEADRAAQRDAQAKRDANTERHDRAMENKPSAPSIAIMPTADGIVSVDRHNLAAGAKPVMGANGSQLQQPDPAQIRTRRDLAESVGGHFDDVQHLIDEADSKGLLGPIKGRTFAEFMSGKVGSTGNPENDELMGELRTQMGMVRSGVAQLHGRAGANAGIAQSIEKRMDEGYMDPAMLKGGLVGLKKWVDTYARKKGGGGSSTSGPADLVFDPATGSFKKPE